MAMRCLSSHYTLADKRSLPLKHRSQRPVKRHHFFDPVPTADREVQQVAGAEVGIGVRQASGQSYVISGDRNDLVATGRRQGNGIIKQLHPLNRQVDVEQFLQYLRRGDQSQVLPPGVEEEISGLGLERVRPANGIDEDITVDEDHLPLPFL